MPDIKEKLVALLREAKLAYRQYLYEKDCLMRAAKTECEFEAVAEGVEVEPSFVADHLISHGVTIQKWISVEERLPEEDGVYITMTNSTGKTHGVLSQKYETSYVRGKKLRRWYWNGSLSPWIVTHWMPLPEPPKGE